MYRHTDSPDRGFRQHITAPEHGWRALAIALYGNLDGDPPDWHQDAACAGTSHEPWFNADGGQPGNPTGRYRHLRTKYCNQCPVIQQCYADTIAWETRMTAGSGTAFGYAAGTSGPERYRTILRTDSDNHTSQEDAA